MPSAFEVDFRQVSDLDALRFQLDEMHTMRLRGKVDRVDLYQDGPSVYVKIVDYKSGAKDIDFAKLYQGLQVQLVLYIDATAEGLKERYPQKKISPGAMFYYHIDRPLLLAGDRTEQGKRAGAFKKELQMKGVVNADLHVIEALHHGLEGRSDVIPAGINKDGSLSKTSSALSEDEFALVSSYVRMLIQKYRQTDRGWQDRLCALPHGTGKRMYPYCEYHGICGFDARMDGFAYRRLFRQSRSGGDFWRAWRRSLQKDRYREERTEGEK